jgi:adenosylcobinamide-phosphate synthase
MDWTTTLIVLALAMTLEMLFGYPSAVFARIRHPVVWIGALIARLDNWLNTASQPFKARRNAGFAALGVLLLVSAIIAWIVEAVVVLVPLGTLLLGVIASSLIASKSLDEHVRAVADGLSREGLVGGRRAVAMIVGRNPQTLDANGVSRAAIESLAENFSDGVVAPVFWLGLFGLPGGVLYKAINTADSMIGHRTPRHEAFGFAAAKLDDYVNLPASRLSALFVILAAFILPGADPAAAWRAVWRDAGKHRSPNAGWPEAAFAGALGLKLNGPKVYGDVLTKDAYMGDGRAEATHADILRALNLYRIACLIQVAIVFAILFLVVAL